MTRMFQDSSVSKISLQANNLHWQCLKILPRVYGTPLWDCICNTLDIITEGVRVSFYKLDSLQCNDEF